MLDRFVRWFGDPHLFVFQSTWLDSAETERARAVRISSVTESTARAYLAASDRKLDPIEGIWYDGRGLRVAVVPDTAGPRLMTVVLTSDTTLWPVGAVRASIERRVFDGPTAGALDYPNVNVVRVAPNERRWHLGYRTMASSGHLPRNGMRG